MVKNILFVFFSVSAILSAESKIDFRLILETYNRGDMFNVISYTNEYMFENSNTKSNCKAYVLQMEAFAESGYINYIFDHKNKLYKLCGTDFSDLYLSSLIPYYVTGDKGYNFLFNKLRAETKYKKVILEFMILFLLENEKIKTAKRYLKLKKDWYVIEPIALNRFYKYIKHYKQYKKNVYTLSTKGSFFPGAGEYLLNHKEAGVGAFSIISILGAGGILSVLTGGFFEPWFLMSLIYYGGSISNTLKIAEKKSEAQLKLIKNNQLFNNELLNRKKVFLVIFKQLQ